MSKDVVGYCPKCKQKTRHKKIQCESNLLERTFLAVITLGFSEMDGHSWECECKQCGRINTITYV